MARRLFCLTVAALAAGCAPSADEISAPTALERPPLPIAVSPDPWVLTTEDPGPGHRGVYLGSGLLGWRVDVGGGLYTGRSQPAYMAGHYLKEVLAPIPGLSPFELSVGGVRFGEDPSSLRDYRQELRLREGVLVTRSQWDTGAGYAEVEVTLALIRHEPGTAVLQVEVHNRGSRTVSLGIAPEWNLRVAGQDLSIPLDGGLIYRIPLGALTEWRTDFDPRRMGGIRSDVRVGRAGVTPGLPSGDELDRHRDAWAKLWTAGIEIEGDPEADQVVRACLFQLLCSTRSGGSAGIPPMGLSGGAFNGHVFWDQESWILPALLPLHPQLCRPMLEYRFQTLPGARFNAAAEGLPGASYAWESAATGKETLLAEVYRHGRHVTGDVALALKQYYAATGDQIWLRTRAWPILKETAANWVARAKPAGQGKYVIRDVTTPDENAGLVDHSAWTHHVAAENLRFAAETARRLGHRADPKWEKVAAGLGFLRDRSGLILAYEGFNERSKAKQADALLLFHPGGLELPRAETERMYDFYAPRVIRSGPAMTEAIHAIVAARLGRGEEALARFRESYRPFVRPPFHLFSEKRSRDNLCFLTGAAGVVEAVLYGFAGLRLEPGEGGRPRLEPSLPPGWKSLRIRGLAWRGRRWDVALRPGTPVEWTPRPY